MRAGFGWVFVGMMACTSVGTAEEPDEPSPAETPAETPPPAETPTPVEAPTPPAEAPAVTVQMTAATLADDCGESGAALMAKPQPASKSKPKPQAKSKAKMDLAAGDVSARRAKARRACQQTSMQLSVVAAAGTTRAQLHVTKVELLDEAGALLGELTPRSPSVWSDEGAYQAWDEGIDGGQELSVSYVLSEPPWGDVSDRRNRTYVLKAAITIDGDEQLVQREVEVAAPTILPPNVKT